MSVRLAALYSASPNAAISHNSSAVKGNSQAEAVGDFSTAFRGEISGAVPLHLSFFRDAQDMIRSSRAEPETTAALNPPLVTGANLRGLARSIEVFAAVASSLVIPGLNLSRDQKSPEPGGEENEAPESSLTSFATPAKTASSTTTRSGFRAEKGSIDWSLDREAQVASAPSRGALLIDKILGVSTSLNINSRASTLTAHKPSYKQSNIEYSDEVISSQGPKTQRVFSVGSAISDEVSGLPDRPVVRALTTISLPQNLGHGSANSVRSPDPLLNQDTNPSRVPLVKTVMPPKASAAVECPAIDSLGSGSIPVKLVDQPAVDQHSSVDQTGKSTQSVLPVTIPIFVYISPSREPGAFVETSRAEYNNAQHPLPPTANPKDAATKSSQVFVTATQPGITTLAPLTLLPSPALELLSISEKGPSNAPGPQEQDRSSQFALRSSPMPLSPAGSSARSIRESGEEEAKAPGSDLVAFKATLTPTELAVHPRVTMIKNTITWIGSKGIIASSPDNTDAVATAMEADPDLAEVKTEAAPDPIKYDLAENVLQEAELHKDNVTDTFVVKLEHRPTVGGLASDPSVVLSPAGNTSSGTDESKTDSQPPEKSESKNEINSPNPPQPTRDIFVKVEGGEMANADIRLSERGGRILVSVRSGSPELAQSLRADLGDLVGRLESRGYRADVTIPITEPTIRNQPGPTPSREPPDTGRGSGHQPRQQNQQESRSRPAPAADLFTFRLGEGQTDERKLNP